MLLTVVYISSIGITLNGTISEINRHAIWLRNPASPASKLTHKGSNYQDESEVEFLEDVDEACDSDDPLLDGHLCVKRECISPTPGELGGPPRDVKPNVAELGALASTARGEGGVATAHDLDEVDQPVGSAAVDDFSASLAPETMMLITRASDQTEDDESELDVDGDDSAKSPANRCEFCGSVFSRAVQRLSHKCTSTFTCSYCAWRGSSHSELQAHELQLHQAKKPHVCPECSARWVSAAALTRHMSVHAKGKTTCACDGCGANFTTVLSLRRHGRDCPGMRAGCERDVKPAVLKNKPPRYLCKVCCATFICKKSVLRHAQTAHTLKFPHKCSICVASFKSKMALTKHVKVHSLKRPFSCSECGLAFSMRPELLQHLKLHMSVSSGRKGGPPLVHAIKKELGVADEELRRSTRSTAPDIVLGDVKVHLTRLLVDRKAGLTSQLI